MASTRLRESDIRGLLQLTAQLAELPASSGERPRRVLEHLCRAVGGCWGVLFELATTKNDGLPPPGEIVQVGGPPVVHADGMRYLETGDPPDPAVARLLDTPRSVRFALRQELLRDRDWYLTPHFNERRRLLDIDQQLYGKVSLPDGRLLGFGLHRAGDERAFTRRDRDLVQLFFETAGHLAWPARPAADMDPRRAALPPRLRPVLDRLLEGDTEKEAAHRLGLSRHTVHQYTKALYRTFDVRSRGELLARLLNGGAKTALPAGS